MPRWISSDFLQKNDVMIWEQLDWIKKGLPVYNIYGEIIFGSEVSMYNPDDFLIIESKKISFSEFYDYLKRRNASDIFKKQQYKRDEIRKFLELNKLTDMIESETLLKALRLPPHDPNEIINDLNKKVESLQEENKNLKEQISNIKLNSEEVNMASTQKAFYAREEKTAKQWAESLEVAVSFTIDCVNNGKPKSTQQHLAMWRERWKAPENTTPRKEAFAAFRRALPPSLKKGSCEK